MNCTCKVEQRRLTPGVFNLKQFLNGSETMIWTLDNCLLNDGTCDLRNYDAFLVLSVGGEIDEIMLTKRQTGDTLQLLWNVGTYATALTGYVKYQITFRSATFDTLGVIAEDAEANGTYSLMDQELTGDARIFQKAENGYLIQWDTENGCWALYQADGATVVDYQTTPSTEPHCGTWGTVAVGNNEAAAWISDEAIMYISESIAADQAVTAGYPTILRQLWAKVQRSGVSSVNGKSGIVELFPEDIGAAAEDHSHEIEDTNGLQDALDGKAAEGHTHTTADVTDLAAALATKSDTGHGHQIADTEGLQDALDGKAATEHGHTIGNVTGLQEALNETVTTAGTGLTKSTNTLSLATVVTAGNAGPTANASPGYGGTFTVPYFTFDAYGRVTGRTNRTITMPANYVSASGTYYIRFTNGLQICWGTVTADGTTSQSVTLPKAFVDKNYKVVTTPGAVNLVTTAALSTAASYFTLKSGGTTTSYKFNYIAIGYWK